MNSEDTITVFHFTVPQAAICLLQGLADSYDGLFALRTANEQQAGANRVLECYVDRSNEQQVREIIDAILGDCGDLIEELGAR